MENRQEGSEESVHSLHSQDTEIIDETTSFDSPRNVAATSGAVSRTSTDSLFVHAGSSREQSLIEFCTTANESVSTACSTPHEPSKLASVHKRRYNSSSDQQVIKKPRVILKDYPNRGDISSSTNVVEYAEANSSTSPNEKSVTNSSTESVDPPITVKKRGTPDYLRPGNKKVPSEACNGFDNIDLLKMKNAFLENELLKLRNENRDLKAALMHRKPGDLKESAKDHRGKLSSEWVLALVSYFYDDIEGEITSISLKQVRKPDLFSDSKIPRLSLSSGSLADSSGSETSLVHRTGPSMSVCSSSSISSSSSSVPSHAGKLQFNKFLIPQIPDSKKPVIYKYPKNCVCDCFCYLFTDHLSKQTIRCITPETLSSSSENIKPDSQDFNSLINDPPVVEASIAPKENIKEECNIKEAEKEQEESVDNCPQFRSRTSIYIPASNNLPVFAKWPSNSYCYPGIVENATEDTWHTNSHLEVKFCDGTIKKILSENLFPAYLLPSGTEISYEKDDVCETAVLISIERLLNNELVCLGESKKGIGETVNIPFEKIFLSDYCYKGLKKELNTSITPRRTPKFSISTANVQEGKRVRKLVKFENSDTKLTGSSGRKAKTKGKRTRSVTSSSSETSYERGRKRPRSFSQKKQQPTISDDQSVSTPHGHSEEKREVSRKLYVDTPCCSKPSNLQEQLETPEMSSTDTDLPLSREVKFSEVSGHSLDSELIPEVSQRSMKSKSMIKKNIPGSKDDGRKGPIPEKHIFSGYNFVLTHSNPKKNPLFSKKSDKPFSEEGCSTDFEDYYILHSIPFDYFRLREQITSGGGRVYRYILDIPSEEHKNSILITDNIVETPNYLLAVTLGIPIYRFDLIINCCIEGKEVAEMLGHEMKMPYGRSLDDGSWVLKKTSTNPLKGYTCLISLNGNESTINFWWHVLNNAGARIIQYQNTLRLISDFGSRISFIVGDEATPEEVLLCAQRYDIPVVTTVWVIQTIIHGKETGH